MELERRNRPCQHANRARGWSAKTHRAAASGHMARDQALDRRSSGHTDAGRPFKLCAPSEPCSESHRALPWCWSSVPSSVRLRMSYSLRARALKRSVRWVKRGTAGRWAGGGGQEGRQGALKAGRARRTARRAGSRARRKDGNERLKAGRARRTARRAGSRACKKDGKEVWKQGAREGLDSVRCAWNALRVHSSVQCAGALPASACTRPPRPPSVPPGLRPRPRPPPSPSAPSAPTTRSLYLMTSSVLPDARKRSPDASALMHPVCGA